MKTENEVKTKLDIEFKKCLNNEKVFGYNLPNHIVIYENLIRNMINNNAYKRSDIYIH